MKFLGSNTTPQIREIIYQSSSPPSSKSGYKKVFQSGDAKEKLTADSISPKEHFSHSHKAGDQMLSRCQYHHHHKHNHQTLSKPHNPYHHQTHHQPTSSITNKLEQTMSAEKLCLNWNDFQENTLSSFKELRADKEFTDVTLACGDGHQVVVHKVVLSCQAHSFATCSRRTSIHTQ